MAQTSKQEMIEFIESLPDDVSMNDIMYHFYVKETLLQRMSDIDEKRVKPVSEQEAQDQIQKWLK